MVRYLFYTIGDLTYQSPLVVAAFIFLCYMTYVVHCVQTQRIPPLTSIFFTHYFLFNFMKYKYCNIYVTAMYV